MTAEEFFESVCESIKQEEFPSRGVTYVRLRNGEEFFLNGYIFAGLTPAEISLLIIALNVECETIYAMSPLYRHGVFMKEIKKSIKNKKEINNFFSYLQLDYSNFTDLKVFDEDYPKKINLETLKVIEKCYSYNSETKNIVRANLLSEINNDVINNELKQRVIFLEHWKKFYKKASDKTLSDVDSPIGENDFIETEDIDKVIKNYYRSHYDDLYSSVSSIIDSRKRVNLKDISNEDEGNEEDASNSSNKGSSDDPIKDLLNNLGNNTNNTNNKNNNKKDNERKSKEDDLDREKDSKSKGESFRDKLRKKFGK